MSNLSNIGFGVDTEEQLKTLVNDIVDAANQTIAVSNGQYIVYSDPSGAELWLMLSNKNELLDLNPFYKGNTHIRGGITKRIAAPNDTNQGAFYFWPDADNEADPESGVTALLFDVPDFCAVGKLDLPQLYDVQLSLFALELSVYENEEAFSNSQTGELKYAAKSFVPNGLFSYQLNEAELPEAQGALAGIIIDYSKKKNEFTQQEFYWLLVESLWGETDVVADINYFENTPAKGNVIHGTFWIAGRVINAPKAKVTKTFLERLFGV